MKISELSSVMLRGKRSPGKKKKKNLQLLKAFVNSKTGDGWKSAHLCICSSYSIKNPIKLTNNSWTFTMETPAAERRSIIRLLCLLLQQPLCPSMLICRFALTQFSPLQTEHAKEDTCGIDLESLSQDEVQNVAQVPRYEAAARLPADSNSSKLYKWERSKLNSCVRRHCVCRVFPN